MKTKTFKIKDLIRNNAKATPEKTAIIFGSDNITYGRLHEAVEKVAGALAEAGVKAGETVAMVIGNCPEFIVGMFSTIQLDAVAFPVGTKEPGNQLKELLKDSKAACVLYMEGVGFNPSAAEHTCVRTLVRLRRLDGTAAKKLEGFKPRGEAGRLKGVVRLHSSGSTGKPKHTLWKDSTMYHSARFLEAIKLTRDDVFLGTVPLHHSYGLQNVVIIPLYLGATVVVAENFFPHNILKLIQKNRVTAFYTNPFMLGVMADSYQEKPMVLDSLRYCISSGGPVSLATAKKFEEKYGVEVLRNYGSSETAVIAVSMPGERGLTVGKPIPGMEARIFDDNYAECPTGEVGRIGVRGPPVIKGYINQPEEDERAFKKGFLFLGDRGFMDENGRLTVTGRDDVANIGGLKVDIAEVENALRRHPAVKEAAAYYSQKESLLKAAIVPTKKVSVGDIQKHCSRWLADYKIPKKVVFLERLPRNEAGKVIKRELEGLD